MRTYRRHSIVGALILIVIGALFLYSNFNRSFDPWPFVSQYWPLLLVFIGIGKLWDYYRFRQNPEASGGRWFSGGEIALIVLLILFFGGLSLGGVRGRSKHLDWAQSVDRGAAESVRVVVEMPAGDLRIDSNANKLLEADFEYQSSLPRPAVSYTVNGTEGELRLSQEGDRPHVQFGPTHNTWNLHLAHDVPMEMRVNVGAGRSEMQLGGLDVRHIDVNMGAGMLIADLGGNWKQDTEASFHGGAGNATIRLPRNVGVVVRARGGLGSIQADGLIKEGETYVNSEYGKSPVTLHVSVEGGVGLIRLETVS